MAQWHIGCSGFRYKHWRGSFYPEKLAIKNWFDYYAEHFSTLELNVTFYRFPHLSLLENWYQKSPSNFLFSVKVPRLITHFKKFNDTERSLSDFYGTVHDGLKEKCGCCLFQFPPSYHYTEEKLEKIISGLELSFPNVLEFRHESWWRDDVFKALASKKISFCGMSHPSLPREVIQNTDLLYYRFHGIAQLYASDYSDEQLNNFAKEIISLKKAKQVYLYFNNDVNTFEVYNAKHMR